MGSDTAHVSTRHPKRHRLSTNHYQGGWQCHTSRRYNCQRSPLGGESLPNPPQIKLPPRVVQVHRTAEDLPLEGGEMVADLSVTPGGCWRRLVCSCHVRRVTCPPHRCQVFYHQRHLEEPSLSMEVGQGAPSMIPHDWWPNFAVRGGRRTLSMCSGSTTNTMLPPLRRRNG